MRPREGSFLDMVVAGKIKSPKAHTSEFYKIDKDIETGEYAVVEL